MIEVRELEMAYRVPRTLRELLLQPFSPAEKVRALHGIHFQVRAGEVFGLLGPNGAGKTTLIKILANLVVPTSGEVTVAGYDVRRNPRAVRRSVGYVPSDERSFFWRMSGHENLRFFAALMELSSGVARARIAELLETFDLTDIAARRFGTYSSGQKKLLTIVRALLADPPVVIMDEPTNSLDPPAAQRLMEYVRAELATRRGKTVLWATHRLEEVRILCDRVALIDAGQRRFLGTVDEFVGLSGLGVGAGGELAELMQAFDRLIAEREEVRPA